MKNNNMADLYATPIIEEKFWIVEQDGMKFATLRKVEDDRFVMSNEFGIQVYETKEKLTQEFGKDFFLAKIIKPATNSGPNEVHGFPASTTPCNAIYDVQRKLPLFTKGIESKSHYCAGHYIIRFDKGWVKSFCPKLITLQRYEFVGPVKTEFEAKQLISNATK